MKNEMYDSKKYICQMLTIKQIEMFHSIIQSFKRKDLMRKEMILY